MNVLLAAEDERAREELATGLRRDGHHVIEVEDGLELEDYLELCNSTLGLLPRPDAIISEVALSGYSGTSALQDVRRQDASVPFIFLDWNIDPRRCELLCRMGANCVVGLPVDARELSARLSVLVGTEARRRAAPARFERRGERSPPQRATDLRTRAFGAAGPEREPPSPTHH